MGLNSDIQKSIRNIVVLALMLMILASVQWFYEPLTHKAIPEDISTLFLTLSLILPASIIINVINIKRKLESLKK